MEELYLVKIGEIGLKGGNRGFFEKKLKFQVKSRLQGISNQFTGRGGRFYLRIDRAHREQAESVLGTTFGIIAFSRCLTANKDRESIEAAARKIEEEFRRGKAGSEFKVEVRRIDKRFPMRSYELAAHLGDVLLRHNPGLKVNVRAPNWKLHVEIRDRAYLYGPDARGSGGLPVGCAGRGGLLLSGGIDSPVAGYLMSKRGLKLDAIYFHAYPYTPDDAKRKVVELARRMAPYNGGLNLFVVPFTDIQLEIKKRGPLKETTLLTRAAMVEAAGRITRDRGGSCLVTGEALSQVASQTVQSMAFTESTADLPILRPLIGFDKEEVIAIARRIETFETSILPYEDCCALFSPKHPVIKPDKEVLRASYEGLRLREGLEEAIENTEKIYIAPGDGILPPKTYLPMS